MAMTFVDGVIELTMAIVFVVGDTANDHGDDVRGRGCRDDHGDDDCGR